MKNHGRIVGVVVLVLILAAAIGIALWPVALVQAAFGRDIGPDASRSAEAGAWVATGLVRVAGMLVGAFAAMILATWTKSVASRGVFAVVGGLAVLVGRGAPLRSGSRRHGALRAPGRVGFPGATEAGPSREGLRGTACGETGTCVSGDVRVGSDFRG